MDARKVAAGWTCRQWFAASCRSAGAKCGIGAAGAWNPVSISAKWVGSSRLTRDAVIIPTSPSKRGCRESLLQFSLCSPNSVSLLNRIAVEDREKKFGMRVGRNSRPVPKLFHCGSGQAGFQTSLPRFLLRMRSRVKRRRGGTGRGDARDPRGGRLPPDCFWCRRDVRVPPC